MTTHQEVFVPRMLARAATQDPAIAEWLEADLDVHQLLSEALDYARRDQDWELVAALAYKLAELDQGD